MKEEFSAITIGQSSIDTFVSNWRKYEKHLIPYAKAYKKSGALAESLIKKAVESVDQYSN